MMKNTPILEFLRSNPLFQEIPEDSLEELARGMTTRHLLSGEYLLRQGDKGSTAYLLVQGRLRVYASQKEKRPISEICPGELVGELAILTDMPRTADVLAIRDSMLIEIKQETFKQWFTLYPALAMKMVDTIVKRFVSHRKRDYPLTTLALLPTQHGIDINRVASALQAAIEPYMKCLILSEEDEVVKKAIESDMPVSSKYLDECESKFEFVLFVACPQLNVWTKQCIRQVDQIFMVTGPQLTELLPPAEYLITDKSILAKKSLLVLHKPETKLPTHTDKLMQLCNADSVFHARGINDYERIGRALTGNSVSLVFSGGGLRGGAHIGLIFALEDNNIPIDYVGGTSFGALIAAVSAQQLSRSKGREFIAKSQKELPKLMDYTLPITSFLRGENLYQLLTMVLPADILLEDLWIPVFCTATNLTDSEIMVIDRGPAWEAVRASISLPGIFPPVIYNEKVIVDGAIFNTLPVDIMCERNYGGKIIASHIIADMPAEHYYLPSSKGVSGFDMWMDKFRIKPHSHLPSLPELLMNAGLVLSQKQLKQVKPMSDYCINLNMNEFQMLDVAHWSDIVDQGYHQACEWIKQEEITREKILAPR